MPQAAFNPIRRQLLRGDTGARRLPLRPPWAVAEPLFIDACSRCGDCINQCPEVILIKGSGGFPEVDFSRGECTFCGDCVKNCQTDALQQFEQLPPWNYHATISDACITHKQVVCRSCVEQCEPEAITLTPQPGGVGTPELDSERCSGCGACVSVCPSQAIQIQPTTETLSVDPNLSTHSQ